MKHDCTVSHGSFTVWGTGFVYSYEADNKLLNITLPDEEKAIVKIKLDDALVKNPLAYIDTLDKTNQIKALLYSNNSTLNLAETLDESRVASLIKTTARISRCAYDLNTRNFERFGSVFCKDFDLKGLKIKKFTSRTEHQKFYLGRIQTRTDNIICVRSCTLSGLMTQMSDRTMNDLIALEIGMRNDASAHKLLSASSKMLTISHILNKNFIPQHKLTHYDELIENLKPSHRHKKSTH